MRLPAPCNTGQMRPIADNELWTRVAARLDQAVGGPVVRLAEISRPSRSGRAHRRLGCLVVDDRGLGSRRNRLPRERPGRRAVRVAQAAAHGRDGAGGHDGAGTRSGRGGRHGRPTRRRSAGAIARIAAQAGLRCVLT